MNKKSPLLCLLVLSCLVPFPVLAAKKSPPAAPVNDFPTQARIEYVLQCMDDHGGQNLNNLYHCVCAVDALAANMNYADFSQAQIFTQAFNMGGDRGGVFRDPPQSARLRNRLKDIQAKTDAQCFPAPANNNQ
ncbi:hypothetical protein FJZ55_03485 [Candidatus Woesearchaeota archaeon]|nr:hypothetical protein [Candidatus Woesearchaeota archaeon]